MNGDIGRVDDERNEAVGSDHCNGEVGEQGKVSSCRAGRKTGRNLQEFAKQKKAQDTGPSTTVTDGNADANGGVT